MQYVGDDVKGEATKKEERQGGACPLGSLVLRMGSVPTSLRTACLAKGWREYDQNTCRVDQWNLWWKSGRFKPTEYKTPHELQRMNHFPKSSIITKKDSMLRALRKAQKVYGSVYNFFPESFILPNEYTKFMKRYSEQEKPELWICKPDGSSRGRGIFLIKDPFSDLKYDQQYIVQHYIQRPLLVGGYKMDLRIYVLVRSFKPLRAYIYRDGLARFGTEKYEANVQDISNQYSHLTNASINKHSKTFSAEKDVIGAGCKWTFGDLKGWFVENGHDWENMWGRTRNLISLTLLTAVKTVPIRPWCFELFGFDVMLDEKLEPSLIEVNCSPALGIDEPADKTVKIPLLDQMIELLDIKPFAPENVNKVLKEKMKLGRNKNRNRKRDGSSLKRRREKKPAAAAVQNASEPTIVDLNTLVVPGTNFEKLFPFNKESEELSAQLEFAADDMQMQKIERSIAKILRTEQRLYKQQRKTQRQQQQQAGTASAAAAERREEKNNMQLKLDTAKQIDTFLNGSSS